MYDNGDCDCAPGCGLALLYNPTCDQACNVAACGFDAYQCGECAPSCKWSQVNNSSCDVACNVSAGYFDNSKCICSE